MSKILLTGGSGFIGKHFRDALPLETVNLDISKQVNGRQIPFVNGDIRVPEQVEKVMSEYKVSSIISLAAKHHDFGIGHDEYFDTNESGTQVICDAATKYGVKDILFFSSVAVYGIRSDVSSEDTNPQPDSPYGASKLAGERVLKEWAVADPGRRVIIIRPTLVFGAHNMANMRNLIRQIDSGFYFHLGKADNIKSIAYVENVVQAALFLREKLGPGVHVFNYADEPQMTTKMISQAIAQALGKKIRLTVPRALGIMMGIPFDVLIKVTGKNLPISTATHQEN